MGWGRCATGSTLQLLLLSCIQFVMDREGGGLLDGGGMQLGQHSSCCCCHVSSLSWLGRGGGGVKEREEEKREGGGLAEECVLCVHTNKVAAPFQKKVLLWKTLNLTPIQPLTLLP